MFYKWKIIDDSNLDDEVLIAGANDIKELEPKLREMIKTPHNYGCIVEAYSDDPEYGGLTATYSLLGAISLIENPPKPAVYTSLPKVQWGRIEGTIIWDDEE